VPPLRPSPRTPTHVTNLASKFEDPTPIRSWVRPRSYNVYRWLPLKMFTRPLHMRRITWPVSRGFKNDYIFGMPDPDLPIHYTTFIGLRRRIRVVYSRAVTNAKALAWLRKCLVRDLVTLTFDRLTLISCHTFRVTWPILPPSLKTLRLLVHKLRVITVPTD